MFSTPMRRRMPVAHGPAPLTRVGLWPALWLTALLVAPAQAQLSAPTRPDPLDPKARVPSVSHESSLASFRRAGDDKPIPWREANDAVARIGGWKVYAREAQQPEPAATKPAAPAQAQPSAPAPTAAPVPPGRPGHQH